MQNLQQTPKSRLETLESEEPNLRSRIEQLEGTDEALKAELNTLKMEKTTLNTKIEKQNKSLQSGKRKLEDLACYCGAENQGWRNLERNRLVQTAGYRDTDVTGQN